MRSLFLFLLLLISVPAYNQTHNELRALYLRLSSDSATMDSALDYSFRVRDAALKEYGNQSPEYIRALNNIGFVYAEKGKYHSSRHWWQKALKDSRNVAAEKLGSLTELIYRNLRVTYSWHFRRLDSASFFAEKELNEHLQAKGFSAKYAALLATIAYDMETAWDYETAKKYYDRALEARTRLFGKRDARIIRGLDSLLKLNDGSNNADRRIALFGLLDSAYSYEALDSLAQVHLDNPVSWDCINYCLALMDASAQRFGDTSEQFISSLSGLGWAYLYFLYEDSAAVFCHHEALRFLEEDKNTAGELYIGITAELASVYSGINNFSRSMQLGHQMLKKAEDSAGKNSAAYALAALNLGKLYSDTSFLDPQTYAYAKYHIWQAIQIREAVFGDGSEKYGRALQTLGSVNLRWAQLDSAELYFLKAHKVLKRHLKSSQLYYLNRQIYMTYSYKEDYARSNHWLEECVRIRRVLGDTFTESHIRDLYNLAQDYLILKDLGKTRGVIERMQNILDQAGDSSNYVYLEFLALKAEYEQESGNYSKAAFLLKYVVRTLSDDKFFDQHNRQNLSDLAKYSHDLANVFFLEKKLDSALIANRFAMNKFTEARSDTSTAYLLQRAEIMTALKNYDSSEYFYRGAISALQRGHWENSLYYQQAKVSMAELYWARGDLEGAEKMLFEACNELIGIMVNNLAGYSENEKEKYNRKLQENLYKYYSLHRQIYQTNPAAGMNCFNFVLRSKGLLLNTSDFLEKSISSSADPELKTLYADLKTLRKELAMQYSSKGSSRDSLESAISSIEKRLSLASAGFRSFLKDNTVTYEDVQKAIREDEAAVEFIAFRYYADGAFTDSLVYAAFVIQPGQSRPQYVPLTGLENLATYLGRQGSSGRGAGSEKLEKGMSIYKELYKLAWQPFEALLPANCKKVFISGDGLFNNVSFTSLSTPGGSYLGDKYKFRYILSSKDIPGLGSNGLSSSQITLFGGAEYDLKNAAESSDSISGMRSLPRGFKGSVAWNYLPNTLAEVQNIKKKLGRKKWHVEMYTGRHASEYNFKKLGDSASPEVLHIATHGFYLPADAVSGKQELNPLLRTGLVFSAANDAWLGKSVEPGAEDGILTAFELANLDLSHTKLVVMSACETGIGDVMNGEGVFGLQRAIRQAGVQKMIVSLWSVPDKETAEMMEEFYSELLKVKDIAVAFHKAQGEMRKRYPQDPSLWAGFILIE